MNSSPEYSNVNIEVSSNNTIQMHDRIQGKVYDGRKQKNNKLVMPTQDHDSKQSDDQTKTYS